MKNTLIFTIAIALAGSLGQAHSFDRELPLTPGAQTASIEGNLALWHNPAGLAFMGGAQSQASYLYEWFGQGNRHHGGFDVATNWWQLVSLGVGAKTKAALSQTARNNLGTDLEGIFGSAVKLGQYTSFGVSFAKSHNFLKEKSTDTMVAFGLQTRPWSFLSVGSHYQEVHNGYFKAPIITNGISIRPYKEWVTLGLDGKWVPKGTSFKNGFDLHPLVSVITNFGGISASVSAEIPGVAQEFNFPIITMGLDINLAHLGLSFQGLVNGVKGNHAVGSSIRMSSQEWPSIIQPKGLWVELTIDGDGNLDHPPSSLAERFFVSEQSPLATLALLKRMESDSMIEGILLKINGFNFGDARAQEWRDALLALKQVGKKVVVYLDAPSERDYFVATAADQIFMNKESTLSLKQFQATLMYFADLLHKFGIQAEAVYAGSYKTAPRQWTNARPEKEELLVMNNILNSFYEELLEETSQARKIDKTTLKLLFDKGELSATDAHDAKLVDSLVYEQDVVDVLDKEDYKKTYFPRYEQRTFKQIAWHDPKKIVVIPITNTIVDGRGSPGLFSSLFKKTHAKDVVDALEDAVDDPDVIGIMVRIDSPGGDAQGGARIAQTLAKAQKKKPIVTSMSDVAASAGYMIAAQTNHIVAEPNTITGSIGVFSLMFSAEALAKKAGIFTAELSPLKNPGPTIARGFSKEEKEAAQKIIDWYYANFISGVSTGLGLDETYVKEQADGRVWLGKEALERKLVHELGGFSKALDSILLLSETPKDQPVELEIKHVGLGSSMTFGARLMALFKSDKLDLEVEHLPELAKPYVKILEAYRLNHQPQARLPFDIEWKK